jgi:hypothetical protein
MNLYIKGNVIIGCLAMLVILASCKKYEEGPAFSLRKQSARLKGEWTMDTRLINGVGQVLDVDDLDDIFYFLSDNTFTIIDPGHATRSGDWNFNSNKKDLILYFGINRFVEVYTIKRLTNKEFWYTTYIDNNLNEIHLKAKE